MLNKINRAPGIIHGNLFFENLIYFFQVFSFFDDATVAFKYNV